MRRSFSSLLLSLGIILTFALAMPVAAKDKKDSSPKEGRVSGTVHMINKDTSTITVQKGNLQRQVVYSGDTKWTYRNKPATMDDLKEGRRVIAIGTWDEKTRLMASRVDIRTGK